MPNLKSNAIIGSAALLSIVPEAAEALLFALSPLPPLPNAPITATILPLPSAPSPPYCYLVRSRLRRRSAFAAPLRTSADGYGLTEDGDFAMLGVNAEEGAEDYGEANNNEKKDPPSASIINTGTSIGSQGVGNMLFDEALQRSGRADLGVGAMNQYRDFRGNEVVPKMDPAVRAWLLEVLPSLDEIDVEAYAEGLSNIGFNPRCASLCELMYEDLDFMKVLHRRYLYKEITGTEHPFEP